MAYTVTRDFVPTVSANGFSTLTTFGNYDNFSWKNNFGSDISWTKENHTLKFGAVYSFYRKNENALAARNST